MLWFHFVTFWKKQSHKGGERVKICHEQCDCKEQCEGIFGGEGIVLDRDGGCMTMQLSKHMGLDTKENKFYANKFKNKKGSCFKFNNKCNRMNIHNK